jgi:subtilisin
MAADLWSYIETPDSGFTGRFIVTLRVPAQLPPLLATLGLAALPDASALNASFAAIETQPHFWFSDLGIAIVTLPVNQARTLRLQISATSVIASIEPEFSVRPLAGGSCKEIPSECWGLNKTGVLASKYTGAGVKVALLDTGFDATHALLSSRKVQSKTFVTELATEDLRDHGTGCLSVAIADGTPCRRGIASDASPYLGRIRSDASDDVPVARLIAGIQWALREGVQILSISYGNEVEAPSGALELLAARAQLMGCLIIAAAGNNGKIGQPANTPGIRAVGGVTLNLDRCKGSPASTATAQIAIAAPALGVYTASSGLSRYRFAGGTSIAAPHVAGIAALWCEATKATGHNLWECLRKSASALTVRPEYVGAGLVQAPLDSAGDGSSLKIRAERLSSGRGGET